MPPHRAEYQQLLSVMNDTLRENPDIEGFMLSTGDGVNLVTNLPTTVDEHRLSRIAALAAAGACLASSLIDAVSQETLQHVIIEGEDGFAILAPLTDETVLITLVRKQAKLGLVLLDIQRAFLARSFDLIFLPPPPNHLTTGVEPEYDDLP